MYQSFITTAHPLHLWDRMGDSGAKVLGNNFFLLSPQCGGSVMVLTEWIHIIFLTKKYMDFQMK